MDQLSIVLKTVVDNRGWAQKEACEAFGVSQGALSQYLNGQRTPEKKQLAQILAALDEPERAAIMMATMRDTVPDAAYRSLVLLTDATTSSTVREEAIEVWRAIPLPEDTRHHFELLVRAAKTDPALRALIASLASFVKPETL